MKSAFIIMNTRQGFTLIFAALTLGSASSRADEPVGATQAGDVVYTTQLTDPDSTLTNNIYFYNYNGAPAGTPSYGDTGFVTGNFPDVSSGVPNIDNVGNPFDVFASSFGLLGIDNVASGMTLSQSVFVAFNSANAVAPGTSFNTFFAPFFLAHPDLSPDESTIVAALQDASITDQDTNDENGVVLYQFRDYVIGLSDSNPATAAAINTGSLTLYHFSDATAFGGATASQTNVPEPGTWTLLTVGGLAAGAILRRRTRRKAF
ncbi:MAG: PEP-CTERM sorting domain-containing protein [Gluconacetobacter diazotrophicus]|nr:PEP-CTERM sorting domain-containing protein [Gluconacetobacter diazotrophicus]